MWEPWYNKRQYVGGRKSVPVVLSRLYGPTKNDTAYRSTYGVWNDDSGQRGCGLWGDVRFQKYQTSRNGGSRTATQKRSISQPISGLTTSTRQFRFEALATPKRYGQCGPRCKKHRCAAIEHEHKAPCAADKQKERKGKKRFRTRISTGTVKNTYTTMASIHVQDKIPSTENHDITMGLRNLKKVNESGELEDLPTDEQNCERSCGQCSNLPRKSMEVATYNPESIPNGTHDTGLKSWRTMGTNTEKFCEKEDNEIPVRVLKEQNYNIIQEMLQKATFPIPRVKIRTPIPRVALLKPPISKPYKHLNKLAKTMPKSELQLRTPQPKPWISSPQSLTSRRATPRKSQSHSQTQKLMGPGKLAPRLFTPPISIPFTRTPTISPRSQQDQTAQEYKPEPTKLIQTLDTQQTLNPTLNPEETLNQVSNKSFRNSSEYSSEEASRGDSLVTTTSEFDSSSEAASTENSNKDFVEETPSMYCQCGLCGKSESVTDGSRMNGAAVYRNNPLYSPPQSLTRGASSSSGSAVSWRLFYTLLEVLVWVVLGGALTMGLITYSESAFRAYMADFCRCSGKGVGKGVAGPEVNADGLQSGVVKWVTCMMDDSRSTLTPLR